MELNLNTSKINYIKPVFKGRFTREETAEVIVPDALPDVSRVIGASGTAMLRGKNAENGTVTVSGVLDASVMYISDEAETVRKVDINIPFSATAEDPDISDDCHIVADISIASVDAGMVNTRKLKVRTEISVYAACYLPCAVEIAAPGAGATDEAELLTKELTALLPSSVSEKIFVLTDEIHLDESKPSIGEILKTSVKIHADETSKISNKAIVKGKAITDILYSARDSGELISEHCVSPFSEVVELDSMSGDEDGRCTAALTGIYITRGFSDAAESITLELHAVLQCVTFERRNITYIADAYSTRYESDLESEMVRLPANTEYISARENVSEKMETSISLKEILSVDIRPGEVSVLRETGDAEAKLVISVIYRSEDGILNSISKKTAVMSKLSAGAEITAEWDGEYSAVVLPDGAEIRFAIDFKSEKTETAETQLVRNIILDEEHEKNTQDAPSLIICRRTDGVTHWELAKKYSSTEKMINELNPEDSHIIMVPRKK